MNLINTLASVCAFLPEPNLASLNGSILIGNSSKQAKLLMVGTGRALAKVCEKSAMD